MTGQPINLNSLPASLWAILSPAEQMAAAASFWKSKSTFKKAVEPAVVAKLARLHNYREKYVRERPLDWKAAELCKQLGRASLNVYVDDVLREFLIAAKHGLICAILDAEGTLHEQGWIPEDAPVPTAEVLVRGLVGTRGKHSDRDLLIYYAVQRVADPGDHWEALDEAFTRPEFEDLVSSVLTFASQPKGTHQPDSVQAPESSTPAESNEEFTTLDNLLIKSVVASATGIDGALAPDALEDMVQEVLTLGTDRHRSYFHLGYLDAVLEKEFRGEFAGSNVTRRGWYLAGYLMGRLRSAQAGQVVQVVKDQTKLWSELMADGPMSARMMLQPHLFRRFADAGEWRLLRGLLERTRTPTDTGRAMHLCRMIYETAGELVRRGSSAEAMPLLENLLNRLDDDTGLSETFREQASAAALRKLGQAHLRAGRFGDAKLLLGRALKQPDFPEAANARTDLGLAAAGFRSLDFLLPKADVAANETTVRALERQAKQFEEAVTSDGRSTNAHFVLGIMAFHRGRSPEAEAHLSTCITGMLEKEEAYQTAYLVDWTRFLLAILIAEQCEPARLNEVRNHVERALASPAFFPVHLWARLCRNLSLYDDQSLAESVIQHILTKRGDFGFTLLKESGLLTKSAALRASYRTWLDAQRQAPTRRATELELLLDAALKDGNAEEAAETLDALEGVAKCDTNCIPAFLALMRRRRSEILGLWDERDVDTVEAALLERMGLLGECVGVLQRMFYRCRSDGDWSAAENLLEQIEHLKVPELDVGQLRAQIAHLRPNMGVETATELTLTGINVLYVGGNETQARYEEAIREDLGKRHPGLAVTFYFPGWGSNWHEHFEKLLRVLPHHNVVVINNFVRTQLGRKLRAACGSHAPWRACTGHGRQSLLHSIETAACWVVENRAKK